MNSQEIAQLKSELRQYPPNSAPVLSYGERRSLVAELLDEILLLRQQGYSFSNISEAIHERTDLLIRPNTLKKYFFEEKAKQGDSSSSPQRSQSSSKAPAQKARKSRSASQQTSQPKAAEARVSAAEAKPASEAQTEPEPASAEINAPGTTAREPEAWNDDWDDDDSMTGGLLNEPTFNTIRRN